LPNHPSTLLEESINTADNTAIATFEVATHLLGRMFLELKELAIDDARVHFAMSNSGHAIQRRLDMLPGIIELRKAAPEPFRAHESEQRARALVRACRSRSHVLVRGDV
jgi:hypothetical protein